MKIAFTSTGDQLESKMDLRFGRAIGFFVIDTEQKSQEWIANDQNRASNHGAGIQAAQTIMNHKVEVVVTGNLGPKAFSALNQAGILAYQFVKDNGTVKEAYDAFIKKQLQEFKGSTSPGM